jgi:hypothetical protein
MIKLCFSPFNFEDKLRRINWIKKHITRIRDILISVGDVKKVI